MFLEILLFFVILKNSQAQTCEEKIMEKNDFFISNYADGLLINTDEVDFSKINDLGYDIVLFEYSQLYEIEGIQISATLLQSFQNKAELQICNLINQGNAYYIQCIIGLTFIQEEIDLNYSNKTEIITLPNEVCQSIFYDEKQMFTIFCYSEENFQLISINLDNQVQFYSLYNYPQDSKLKLCTPISIQIKPFDYVIGYLNCSDWRMFEVLDNNITLILDEMILSSYQKHINLTNLVNLQVCYANVSLRTFVYALFDTGYVKMDANRIQVFLLLTQEHKITQLVFDYQCNVILFVGSEESLTQFQYYSQYSTITFSKSIPPPLAHYHEQFKIFQHEKTLQLFVNQKFIQYYDISGLLLFDRTFNHFFAMDSSLNQIKLFKIRYLSKHIVPKYEYIYDFNLKFFNCCENSVIKCTKIKKQDPQTLLQEHDFGNNEHYLIFDNLTPELQIFINYMQFTDGIPIFFEVPPEYKHLLSIYEMKIKLSSICPQHQTFQDLIILLFYSSSGTFVFQDEKNIYFYNCTQQKLFHQVQMKGKSVFTYKNYVIILDRILNLVNIIILYQVSLKSHTIKIDSEIRNAELSLNYILITLKDKEPLIIELCQDDKIIYNTVINTQDQILFYLRDYNLFQIYQVKGYLFVLKNNTILKLKFLDWKILGVDSNLIFIVLHNIDLTLKRVTINKNEVIFLSNLDLFDFSIYQPLTYSYFRSSLQIVAEKYNKLYLLIYTSQGLYQKLRFIIPIGKPNFYFRDEYIYFYDENNILVYMNLFHQVITYQITNFNKIFETTNVHLNLLSQIDFKQYNTYNLSLKIVIQNYQIIPKSNFSIQPISNIQLQIRLFNHFSGPIDNLYLNEKCPFILSGPLLIREAIISCDQSVSSYCLQKQTLKRYSMIIISCVFLKITEEKNSTNHTKLILLSPNYLWYQLRNGDLFQISDLQQEISKVIMYTYDYISDQLIEYKSFNFSFNFRTQILKIGDIIFFQTNSQFVLLYVNRDFIKKIYENQYYFDMVYIENSNEEYIIQNSRDNIEITHYNFSQGNVFQLQTYTIEKRKLLLLCMNDNDYSFKTRMNSIVLNLVDAIKLEFEIRLNGLLNYEHYKFYLTFSINTLNQTIEGKIIKTFRNQHLIDKIQFIDKKFAIFKGLNPYQIYIYDLRQVQEIYDPITEMNMLYDMTIQSYNSTHYIFFNFSTNEAFLIELGYEISVIEKEKSNNCQLIAENGISKAEIQVIIQQEEINNNINYKIIIILSIIVCIFIVLLIFILRRQKLKNNNLKLFQPISLDQSKLQ